MKPLPMLSILSVMFNTALTPPTRRVPPPRTRRSEQRECRYCGRKSRNRR